MALRWGIASAGRISHDFMVGLKALPETEHKTVAVAARSLQSATEFAQTHDIPTAYGSYAELAGDPQVRVCYERFYYEGKCFKETCFLTIVFNFYIPLSRL